jgi:hypothetical protein
MLDDVVRTAMDAAGLRPQRAAGGAAGGAGR